MQTHEMNGRLLRLGASLGATLLGATLILGAFSARAQVIEEVTPNAVDMVEEHDDTCVMFIDDFLHVAALEDPWEIKKLQMFLNAFIGSNLEVNGVYDQRTMDAVEQFQLAYNDEILVPWMNAGYNLNAFTPTGYVYVTTRNTINNLLCVVTDVPQPPLVPDTDVTNDLVGA